MDEVKNIKQKNLAAELLKRLIEGKIKMMAKRNLVESRKFSEMLKNAINAYTNKSLTNIKVRGALIKMAKEMNKKVERWQNMNLSEDEIAFYDALAANDSAKERLGDGTLQQIAHDLSEAIRNNASIDWNLRESVRAKMRIVIKRLLKKYGYPTEKTTDAIKLVMEQAELMAGNQVA